jgi:hypothetical protein
VRCALGVIPPPARGQRMGVRRARARGPGGGAWAALRERCGALAPGAGELRGLTPAPRRRWRNALRAIVFDAGVRITRVLCALALGPLVLG